MEEGLLNLLQCKHVIAKWVSSEAAKDLLGLEEDLQGRCCRLRKEYLRNSVQGFQASR